MAKKFLVQLFTDDEGFFGHESTDGINVQESINDYHDRVTKVITDKLDNCDVECFYGPYGGPSVKVLISRRLMKSRTM